MTEDQDLNADAIYAALVWMRDYAESQEGEAGFRELLDRKADKVDALRSVAKEMGGNLRLIPRFEYTSEFCEEIYPGEPTSVEAGLELARYIVYDQRVGMAFDLDTDSPIGKAIQRFRADRAN